MRWLVIILILLNTVIYAQNPLLRRVCQDPNNNTLYWSNPAYPCSQFHFYIIWASDDNLTFFPVDTNYTSTSELHIHTNANSIPGVPNKFYYVERRDSCGPIYNHTSNTVQIDNENPAYTFLDSVSVDVLTNKVILGWSSNKLPDFNRYFTYKDNPYVSLEPLGTTDTFQTDNTGSDPKTRSFEYDINTTDSCGNPSVFGINPHATIHLTHSVDTCKKTVDLKWSHYKGWGQIAKYYIYQDAGLGYVLVDSVNGNTNEYTGRIILGTAFQYYVRAIKDTSILISSSSNNISFNTRKRVDPTFVRINYVTTEASNESVIINFSVDENAEINEFKVPVFLNNALFTELTFTKTDLNKDINTGLNGNNKYLFQVHATDYCDVTTVKSDSSTNIVASPIEKTDRGIQWNTYFTWDTGVEKYVISRGTGNSNNIYTFSLWQEVTDTSILDEEEYENVLEKGVCYYIYALKNGTTDTISKSNIICFPNPFTVFFPNVFIPTGVNNLFKPEGGSIDYNKSSFQIYDRWGQQVYSGMINLGWDGNDTKGAPCSDGLYYYRAEVVSIKNEKQIKNGSVTLLR